MPKGTLTLTGVSHCLTPRTADSRGNPWGVLAGEESPSLCTIFIQTGRGARGEGSARLKDVPTPSVPGKTESVTSAAAQVPFKWAGLSTPRHCWHLFRAGTGPGRPSRSRGPPAKPAFAWATPEPLERAAAAAAANAPRPPSPGQPAATGRSRLETSPSLSRASEVGGRPASAEGASRLTRRCLEGRRRRRRFALRRVSGRATPRRRAGSLSARARVGGRAAVEARGPQLRALRRGRRLLSCGPGGVARPRSSCFPRRGPAFGFISCQRLHPAEEQRGRARDRRRRRSR